jgi:Family of unknown function (DUF5302)
MAVKHSGTEGPSGGAPSGAEEAEGEGHAQDAQPDLDEVKRKFREALDRKRAHATAGAEGQAQDTGKVHGAHGPASTRRSFRRKSG